MKFFIVLLAAAITSGANSTFLNSDPVFEMLQDNLNFLDYSTRNEDSSTMEHPLIIASNILRTLPQVIDVVPGFVYSSTMRVFQDEKLVNDTKAVVGRIIEKVMEDAEGANAAIDAIAGLVSESGFLLSGAIDMLPEQIRDNMSEIQAFLNEDSTN